MSQIHQATFKSRGLLPLGPSFDNVKGGQIGRLAPIQPNTGDPLLSQTTSGGLACGREQRSSAKLR
jgi:hypothetical protein